MATVSDCIEEAKGYFYSGYRDKRNVLTNTVAAGDTTFTFNNSLDAISVGAMLCIDVELCFVTGVNASAQTATVLRAQNGSAAAAHTAGALVWVNPKASTWDCFRAFNREIAKLQADGLFNMNELELTFNAATYGYDLPLANLLEVYDIRYQTPGPMHTWPRIDRFRLVQQSDTGQFASGNQIIIRQPGFPGLPIRVWGKCGFTQAVALTDDLQSTIGLPFTSNDLPALGIAIRMVSGREIKRNFTEAQGEPRRAEEVPPGANLGSSRDLLQIYSDRLDAETGYLSRLFPPLLKRGYAV